MRRRLPALSLGTLCALSLPLAVAAAASGQESKTAPRTKDGRAAVNSKQRRAGMRAPRVLVEAVEVEGNRLLSDEEILAHVRARPGDVYDTQQVIRDLRALLDLGVFDRARTRVQTTAGLRGGTVVIFHVAELPVVAGLKFEGLPGELTEADVLQAFRAEGIRLAAGDAYDPAALSRALDVVRRLLAARGRKAMTVESSTDVSATHVFVRITVSEGRDF